MSGPVDESDALEGWEALCREVGSPFHTAAFCSVIQRHWPGADQARHVVVNNGGICQAVVPGFLYGACPRLDYYRANVVPALAGEIIGSHALVGWLGGPIARHGAALIEALEIHLDLCRDNNAMSFLFGIDGRAHHLLQELAGIGYRLGRLQTNMVLDIHPDHAIDPVTRLKRKERAERRRVMRRADEAGLRLRIVTPSQAVPLAELIRSGVSPSNDQRDILPATFLRGVLQADLPGMEVLLAVTPNDEVAAIALNFRWRETYYLWLSGNRKDLAKPFYPSDFLYQHAIRRAANLGITEIQGGRSPYPIKLAYGFRGVPIMCAIHPLAAISQTAVDGWIAAQTARHLATYPEIGL